MMTLRQSFDTMMAQGHGYVRLNNLSGLERVTMDAFGRPCDGLFLRFLYVGGMKDNGMYSIEARDFDAVLMEVCECTKDYLSKCAIFLNMDLIERGK